MTQEWIGKHWLEGNVVSVKTEGTNIATVTEADTATADQWIAPTLMDLQVNGINGVSYNNQTVTSEEIHQSVRYLFSRGVARFCPTLTTAAHENTLHRIRALISACKDDQLTDRAVIGIHIEGPYISHVDGPRGVHNRDVVRDPDWSEFLEWDSAAEGRICKVTLAPERKGALDFIERLVDHGVVAAIGHTAATEEEIQRAVDAGATMSTHLGNGAHPLIKRHPNYIWAQLAEDKLFAGLIPDGHHLPPSTLKVMVRVKGDKAILVSDASRLEGLPPGEHQYGKTKVIKRTDGKLHLADNPDILAASAIPLNFGVENIVKFGIGTWQDAIKMASTNAARLFGLDSTGAGTLNPGAPADFIVYSTDENHNLHILETVLQGETVYTKAD